MILDSGLLFLGHPVYCRVIVRLTKLRVNNTENAKQIKQYYFYVQFWRNFTAANEVYRLLHN